MQASEVKLPAGILEFDARSSQVSVFFSGHSKKLVHWFVDFRFFSALTCPGDLKSVPKTMQCWSCCCC